MIPTKRRKCTYPTQLSKTIIRIYISIGVLPTASIFYSSSDEEILTAKDSKGFDPSCDCCIVTR